MPKAILELPEMPIRCASCPFIKYVSYGWVKYLCNITSEEIANEGRRPDCPLKLVDTELLGGETDERDQISR